MKDTSILLIYTGGTIGMRQDPTDGALRPVDFGQIAEEGPELRKSALRIDAWSFDPLIDSSDVEPALWQSLATLIRDRYDQYDGFVVLHGTDTMSYSASALSFMLENLAKPVVFTGSQLPVGAPRTDGRENLVSAIEVAAAKDAGGHALVPEVSVLFDAKLMRGNRSTKVNAEQFDAFSSPNHPLLAEAGIQIRYNLQHIRRPARWDEPLRIAGALDTRVSILKIHPGITPQVVRNILMGPETRAVILETYGSGNAPSKDWFLKIVDEAVAMGKLLVNVTQCLRGAVNMQLYATGKALERSGVVSGGDCTTEGMLAKLFWLLGKYSDIREAAPHIGENIRGEISE